MTNCPACERAEEHIHTGIYQSGCMQCEARALAQSPEANSRERDPDALRAALRRTWPKEDDYRRGRALTWAWIQRFAEET